MPRDLLLYLEDIRDAAVAIRSYVGDRAFEEFVGNRMRLGAVVLRFITIGEATKQIPAEITARHPEVE
nr:HepT-like ribonuclease domain-containing protein [Methanoculleus sp. UBA303]